MRPLEVELTDFAAPAQYVCYTMSQVVETEITLSWTANLSAEEQNRMFIENIFFPMPMRDVTKCFLQRVLNTPIIRCPRQRVYVAEFLRNVFCLEQSVPIGGGRWN